MIFICSRAARYSLYSPPIEPVADGQPDLRRFRARLAHRARQVAPFDAELHTDIARVRFPVDERRSLLLPDIGELAQRQVLAIRRGDQQVLDRILVLAEGLLHAHDQVELLLALNHLRGGLARHGRVDQRVNVGHV